jgi:hypothetical protein
MSRDNHQRPLHDHPVMQRFVGLALLSLVALAACGGEDRLSIAGPPDDSGIASTDSAASDAQPSDTSTVPDVVTQPDSTSTPDTFDAPDVSRPDSPISVAIVEPHSDECLTGDESVTVSVVTTGFVLADPGSCAPADPLCGQAYVTIDGLCNTPGKPYVGIIGRSGEVELRLGTCTPLVRGAHLVRVELHLDSGAALVPTVDAARTVTFRAGPC